MNNIFKLRAENPYNLDMFLMVKSEYPRTESVSYLERKIWEILPEKLNNIENLEHFKNDVKT